jgi:hypothetical protein
MDAEPVGTSFFDFGLINRSCMEPFYLALPIGDVTVSCIFWSFFNSPESKLLDVYEVENDEFSASIYTFF